MNTESARIANAEEAEITAEMRLAGFRAVDDALENGVDREGAAIAAYIAMARAKARHLESPP